MVVYICCNINPFFLNNQMFLLFILFVLNFDGFFGGFYEMLIKK